MTPPPKLVVCDLATSPYVDLAGARMLTSLHAALQAEGVTLRVVNARGEAHKIVRASGLDERLGIDRTVSLPDLVDGFLRGTIKP